MTGAGITVPPARGPAPFARWPLVAASALGWLVAVRQPRNWMGWLLLAGTAEAGS